MFKRISLLFVFFLVCIISTAAFAGTFRLPDTGQTKCYQDVSPYWAEIPCADTGQDGAYSINPMSFTDNGYGTVTDNNTRLIWQKEDDCILYNWYQASGTYDSCYNPSSQNVCGSLMLGGHLDWRLPTRKELKSIVDYSIFYPGPTIDTTYFPTTKGCYWSSNDYDLNYGGYVDFRNGFAGSYDTNHSCYVRCVRGRQYPDHNFVGNNDGTVTDNSTGLTWQQAEPGYMTWGSALSYCEGLSLGGHSDWRLPNVKEHESLLVDTKSGHVIDTTYFPNASESGYWTSTTYAGDPHEAWVSGLHIYKDSDFYVRCVRGSFGPSRLKAKATSSTQIILSWIDNSVNETGFKIERKSGSCSSSNSWEQIAVKGANVTTYGSTGLTPGTICSYRVRAYKASGNFAYSNCASAKTGLEGSPNAPSSLRATSFSTSKINVCWNDNSTDETGFKIYRKTDNGSWKFLYKTNADVKCYSDINAAGNTFTTTYSYYVKACKDTLCSPNTNAAVVPCKPTDLTAQASYFSDIIYLSWTATGYNATGFQTYRKSGDCSSASPWGLLTTTDITEYVDIGLSPGATYSYKTRAYTRSLEIPYAYGYSLYSNCSSATTP